ncbi:MAG: patatin-like phospholipase family protein, partial [Dehalococcoidia bacterium]|nr:patatin-like phospholipase family protein [Dehalococcoidia bacterium]
MYRILALDGGGVRGLLTVILLERLEAALPPPGLVARADLLAGTSTGALIALALARGIPLATLRELYLRRAREVFDDSWLDDLRDLGRLAGAEYSNRGLRRIAREWFGEATLGDLPKAVLVPTFDLDNEDPDPRRRSWKPKLFHNVPGTDADR